MSRERDQEVSSEKDPELKALQRCLQQLRKVTGNTAFEGVSDAVRALGKAVDRVVDRYEERPPTPYVVYIMRDRHLGLMRVGVRDEAEALALGHERPDDMVLAAYSVEDLRELVKELEGQTETGRLCTVLSCREEG